MNRRAFLVGAAALATTSACKPKRRPKPAKLGDVEGIELAHPQPDDGLPLLVALHGHGGAPEHWVEGFTMFPGRGRILLVRGFEKRGAGFAWFPGDAPTELVGPGTGVAAAAARLSRALGGERVAVTGYTEGAMLAFVLAANHPELVLRAFAVAGACPPALYPKAKPAPVTAYHGGKDDVILPEAARESVAAWKQAGGDGVIRDYPGARHDPSDAMHADLNDDIAKALEAARSPR